MDKLENGLRKAIFVKSTRPLFGHLYFVSENDSNLSGGCRLVGPFFIAGVVRSNARCEAEVSSDSRVLDIVRSVSNTSLL